VAACQKELKLTIRRCVWEAMEAMRQVTFPQPCRERIPNFVNANMAAELLAQSVEFQRAATVKINPSLAQTQLREFALRAGKRLLTPSPALEGAFMLLLDPIANPALREPSMAQYAATKPGALECGVPLDPNDWPIELYIDLVVVAAVAVCPNTGARLGKGLGYGELEWAALYELGAVDGRTIVATTVHELQIVADLPVGYGLLADHDLPLHLIASPNRLIRIEKPLPRPCAIQWELLSDEKLQGIPSLHRLRQNERRKKKSRAQFQKRKSITH